MNEPSDFRGIEWGTNYSSLSNMIITAQEMDGRLKYCTRVDDDKMIGKANINSIVYSFFDDKFYEIQVIARGWPDTLALLEYLVPLFGNYEYYEEENHKLYDWGGDTVEVWCGYNKNSDSVELVYMYKPIKSELLSEEGVPTEEAINRKHIVMANIVSQKTGLEIEEILENLPNKHENQSPVTNRKSEKNFNLKTLQTTNPTEFENIVSALLSKMGFNATTTKPSGDSGIDVIAINEKPIVGGKYVVQCKRYATGNNIGEPIIRELFGVMHAENANKGILITTSDFTKQAIAFAEDKAIELINGTALLKLLDDHVGGIKGDLDEFLTEQDDDKKSAEVEKFKNEVSTFIKQEKIKITKKTVSDIDYVKFFEKGSSQFLNESINISAYFDDFVYAKIKEALGSDGGNDPRKMPYILADLFARARDDSNQVHFGLVNDFYDKTLKLFRSLVAMQPSYKAKAYHDNYIKLLEAFLLLFSALKNFVKTNNSFLMTIIIFTSTSIIELSVKASDLSNGLQTNIVDKNIDGSCFIATTVYGSSNAPQVLLLRRWRDSFLSKHWIGKIIISIYYRVGPFIAHCISDKKWIKKRIKILLDSFISFL